MFAHGYTIVDQICTSYSQKYRNEHLGFWLSRIPPHNSIKYRLVYLKEFLAQVPKPEHPKSPFVANPAPLEVESLRVHALAKLTYSQ